VFLNDILPNYARFDQRYFNQGQWAGEQIIPALWHRVSITPDASYVQSMDDHDLYFGIRLFNSTFVLLTKINQ